MSARPWHEVALGGRAAHCVAVRDAIRINGLTVDCVVGVYPRERDQPQPLSVDIEMRLDTEEAAVHERLRETIDYSAMAEQVAFMLRSCRFRLLETAAHALAKYVLAAPAPSERRCSVAETTITLTKRGALEGRAIPSLEVHREAGEWSALSCESKSFGTVDVVHETRDAGIYRLNVAPGKSIPLHVHRRMQESEMVLTDGLHVQGREVPAGTVHHWPRDAPHRYYNPTDRVQSILCVDSPPFMEDDEILVEGEPAEVVPETAWGRSLGARS